jgi:hypothetical protein
MLVFTFMLLQLMSYSLLNWMAFISVAVLFAYFGKGLGIIAGHLVIAVLVGVFDVIWIQSIMAQPGWEGDPDQDLVFMLGMLLRIVLVNTALIPLSLLILRTAVRRQQNFETQTLELLRNQEVVDTV